jgi:methionine biosynthesis protein MetW
MTSLRPDLDVIVHMVPAGSRVLDLGCGDGTLLAELVAQKGVQGRGVEVDEATETSRMGWRIFPTGCSTS